MASLGGPRIVKDGLILYYDLSNNKSYSGSGTTVFDLTINKYNATIVNSPLFIDNNEESHLRLDGTSDYLQVNQWDNSSTTYTVEMVTRWRSGSSDMFIGFDRYDIWTNGGNLGFNTGNSDVYGISYTKVNELNLIGTNQENWHHYIFIFTNQIQNNKIYINGVLQTLSQQNSTTNLITNRTFSNFFRIGGWVNSTSYHPNHDNAIFRMYNRELTQEEILNNYNSQKDRFI